MLNALRERKVYFRKRRGKPILTAEDVKARFAFDTNFCYKPAEFWTQIFAIDGKHFKAYLNGNKRGLAAMHATYGACRAPGEGLHGAYLIQGSHVSGVGAGNILVMAAVGHGKVTMWHQVPHSLSWGPLRCSCHAKSLARHSVAGQYWTTRALQASSLQRQAMRKPRLASRSCTSPSGRRTCAPSIMRPGPG